MGDLARWLGAEPPLVILVPPGSNAMYRACLPEICGPGPVRLVCQRCGQEAHDACDPIVLASLPPFVTSNEWRVSP